MGSYALSIPVLAYPLPTGGGACSQQPVPTMPGHQLQFSEAAQSPKSHVAHMKDHEGTNMTEEALQNVDENKRGKKKAATLRKGEMLPPRQVLTLSCLPSRTTGSTGKEGMTGRKTAREKDRTDRRKEAGERMKERERETKEGKRERKNE